jgi:hypothetical protein
MVAKAALEAAGIPFDQMLQILAGITRTAPSVSVLQSKFVDFAKNAIRQAGNFEVLSYHGRNRRIMNNVTLYNGNLKPTENQTGANRRPTGKMYAKLSCDVLFAEIDPTSTSACPLSYFIRLPTETRIVLNNQGNDANLNTFHGADGWHSTADQAIVDAIWDHPKSYRKPFTLKPPEISDVNAVAELESTNGLLDKIAQEAAWPTITSKVFTQLCLNVVEDPAAVIQSIHQVTKDTQGDTVTLTVKSYFTFVQRMTSFLPKDAGDWSINVTQHFQSHLREDIRSEMKSNSYMYNAALALKDPYSQLMNLQD